MITRILISGASIAGPTLAYWLNAHGWSTTVIERQDALRDEGQNIDIRGAAREVARRMGIEEAIRAASTGELGTEFIDADGNPIASFPASESESGGFLAGAIDDDARQLTAQDFQLSGGLMQPAQCRARRA